MIPEGLQGNPASSLCLKSVLCESRCTLPIVTNSSNQSWKLGVDFRPVGGQRPQRF